MTMVRSSLATPAKVLSNGVNIPSIGLGVYQSYGAECSQAVTAALATGYRHFDSALAYRNERLVGEALLKSDVKRSELFFTTKLPPKLRGYDATKKAIEESLSNCGLKYIDLYLIHAPYGNREGRLGQWRAIEEAISDGKIRAGGVSNYNIHHLQELLDSNPAHKPQINQIELHPFLCRTKLVKFCEDNGILLEAYSPLTRGQRLNDATLLKIAAKYKREVAQILIRWGIQKGM
jgi:diketogulonate reductase-like aldo/keto reductase